MAEHKFLDSLNRPYCIGIAGGTASGKSTLARVMLELLRAQGAEMIHVDAYYRRNDALPMSERERLNYDHPDRLEFDLLEDHLMQLREGRAIEIPVYDYANHNRSNETQHVEATRFLIVEGILTLHPPQIRSLLDYKIFVDAPADLRLQRRIIRDTRERGRTREGVLAQWSATVEPMYEAFCLPSSKYADLTVEGIGIDRKKAQFIIDHILGSLD